MGPAKMAINLTSHEISRNYDQFAPWYDWVEGIPDVLGVRRLRRRLIQKASGRILEVAVGTGRNFPYYRPGSTVIALDLSREMLNIARKRATKLPLHISFVLGDSEMLPFHDKSFDTVVSSFSTCTFPDPVAALKEMARVCRPTGRILLLEHGRSDRERLGRWQDRHADQFAKPLGCHWNREPLNLVRQAGLGVNEARRTFFGILHQIEAVPGPV
jgi:ubiquinone/menaquinone biosynthesis C-methylase UbiE